MQKIGAKSRKIDRRRSEDRIGGLKYNKQMCDCRA